MIFNSELNSFPNIKEKGDIMFCKNVKVMFKLYSILYIYIYNINLWLLFYWKLYYLK